MNMPFELQKQYDATKSFVRNKTFELEKTMKVFKGTIIFAVLMLITMVVIGGVYFLLSLLALFFVGTVYSKVAKMKKQIKEPAEMVEKYDTSKAVLDEFEEKLKFDISDFFLGNLFDYMVRANDEISIDDLFDKLLALEYEPMIEFISENSHLSFEELKQKRTEYFLEPTSI
ncbi:MAG: hypothetical protein R3Y18_04520 [Bacillota bacterium]